MKSKYLTVFLTHTPICSELLANWDKIIKVSCLNNSEKNIIKQEILCRSLGGLPIQIFTVT